MKKKIVSNKKEDSEYLQIIKDYVYRNNITLKEFARRIPIGYSYLCNSIRIGKKLSERLRWKINNLIKEETQNKEKNKKEKTSKNP